MEENMDHRKYWEMIVAEVQRRKDSGESFPSISRLLGSRHSTKAYKIYHGNVTGEGINIDKIKQYLRGLGLPYESTGVPPDLLPEGFTLVRKVSAKLGAGSSLLTEDETDGYFAFRDDFLRRLGMNAKPVLHEVLGDSMEPTLKNGDMVMIDKSETTIRSGQLYAVGIGEELHIKRVFEQPDKTILLKSDNPDFPSWTVPKHERPRVIGRARWLARMI